MRITNKIMQNNSLYNINNNKVAEDTLNTMMSTGKKITRPSEDPVIAIRALRLRSNVVQLSQYYEKNAKDAESWLNVTADALSTVTAVLTDCVKQVTKGANKDLTLDDLDTIVTQIDSLAKEYYSTGNVDFAGRYVFTGYRTETPLTFDKQSTADYTDIKDEFSAGAIGDSNRVNGKYKLDSSDIISAPSATMEHEIQEKTVGRLRLSYSNLNYREGDGKGAGMVYREEFVQPATSTVTSTMKTINLTYQDAEGQTHYAEIPTNGNRIDSEIDIKDPSKKYSYTATQSGDNYVITCSNTVASPSENYTFVVKADGTYDKDSSATGLNAITHIENRGVSTITYTSQGTQQTFELPLVPAIDQTYQMTVGGSGFTATVNSDGTFTLVSDNIYTNTDGTTGKDIINVTSNGSINSSYYESSLEIAPEYILYSTTSEAEKDAAYEDLTDEDNPDNETKARVYLNAATGEILMNKYLKNKLSTLPDIINADSIGVQYDKKEWDKGDIKPEHLFSCTYTSEIGKTILYNKGTAPHNIAYEVGFSQSVIVNTTADAAFSTSVRRDAEDLSNMLGDLKQVNTTLKTLKTKLASTTDDALKTKLQDEINSTQKAFDYMRENLQKEFEHKITSMQKSLDIANIAVTDNGTRSKRLDLISDRLMTQTTTFKTLQSDNEDIDLAEAATKLTTAQVTYEASLMATGKISQTSLMNYI